MATTDITFALIGKDLLGRTLRDVTGEFNSLERGLGRLGNPLANVAAGIAKIGVVAAGAAVTGLGALTAASIKTAISFESAFAGIVKTVDDFDKVQGGMAGLRKEFVNLSKEVPVAFEELARIGELGGQLGIPADQLAGFTRTIAALGVATNLTTEEAATAIARFQNIFQIAQKDVSKNTSQTGSAIVALGNNFATTEREIVAFAERIAGAGKIAGLTQPQVLAIGAAMSSVGVEAEAGGTAVQKVLLEMNTAVATGGEKLEGFAKVAGTTTSEFARLWEQDAGQAFQMFVTGLKREGDNAAIVLDELGIADQRLVRAFLSLAEAGGLLENTFKTSTAAFAENAALQDEAAKRYATTESQLILLKNTILAVGDTIGNIFLPAFANLVGLVSEFINKHSDTFIGVFQALYDALVQIGQLQSLQTLMETIKALLPDIGSLDAAVSGVSQVLVNFADWALTKLNEAISFLSENWETVKAVIAGIGIALAASGVIAIVTTIGTALATLASPIGLVLAAVAALSAAWIGNWGGIRDTVMEAWETTIKPALFSLWEWLKIKVPEAIDTAKRFFENELKPVIADLAIIVQRVTEEIAKFWQTHGDTITRYLAEVWGNITMVFKNGWTVIREGIALLRAVLTGDWTAAGESLKKIWGATWDTIVTLFKFNVQTIMAILNAILIGPLTRFWDNFTWEIKMKWKEAWLFILAAFDDFRNGLMGRWNSFTNAVSETWTNITDNIRNMWTNAWQKVVDFFTEKKEALSKTINDLVTNISEFFNKDWVAVGRSIIEGVIKGVQEKIQRAREVVRGVGNDLLYDIKSVLGIRSPSAEFAKIGENMMAGMEQGVRTAAPLAQEATANAAAGAAQAARQVTDNRQYNLTIHSNAPVEPIIGDFRMMEAMLG